MKHLRFQHRQENWLSPFLLSFRKWWEQEKALSACDTESRRVCRETILLSGFKERAPCISKSSSNLKSPCQFLLPCYIAFLILRALWKNPKKGNELHDCMQVESLQFLLGFSCQWMPCLWPVLALSRWIAYIITLKHSRCTGFTAHRDFRSTFHHCCTHSNEEETTILWVSEPLRVEQLGHK